MKQKRSHRFSSNLVFFVLGSALVFIFMGNRFSGQADSTAPESSVTKTETVAPVVNETKTSAPKQGEFWVSHQAATTIKFKEQAYERPAGAVAVTNLPAVQ
jgi:hypothetical protein